MQSPLPLAGILAGWVDALARRLGASQLALALICEDGTLLAAEHRPGGEPRCEHRPLDDPAWNEVLQTGRPLVVRELKTAERPGGGGWTLFCLPVGTPPQAILAAGFPTAVEAHRFHDVSGEIVYLLEKRLPELVSRFTQRDRLERFAALTAALTEIAAADPDAQPFGASPLDLLADAARRLTGADEAHRRHRLRRRRRPPRAARPHPARLALVRRRGAPAGRGRATAAGAPPSCPTRRSPACARPPCWP